jgi:hypothetical protein
MLVSSANIVGLDISFILPGKSLMYRRKLGREWKVGKITKQCTKIGYVVDNMPNVVQQNPSHCLMKLVPDCVVDVTFDKWASFNQSIHVFAVRTWVMFVVSMCFGQSSIATLSYN